MRFVLLWFALAAGAALFSRAQLREGRAQHCSLDGVPIEGAQRIDWVDGPRPVASFCSVECALAWPRGGERALRFVVHEELHGIALDPEAAYFVRCSPAGHAGRSSLRAFQDPLAAAECARALGGVLVPNPFPETR